MQRRYEISDEQWNKIKHMFPKAKTGRPGKDLRLMFIMQCCGLPAAVHLGETFLNVSVHGRRSIPVSANGVTRELCLKYLSI